MKTNRHRAEVIEVLENGTKAAVKFTSGRIECVTRKGTYPSPFYIGEKGIVEFVLIEKTGTWMFERKAQKSYSNYWVNRRRTKWGMCCESQPTIDPETEHCQNGCGPKLNQEGA